MKTRLGRLFLAALLLLGTALPSAAYVLCANGTNDQHYVFRDTGSAGLTTGEYTVTWQQWIEADRPASFQTYYGIGPTTFDALNDYDVAFDGDGSISNNMASGAEGADTYSTTLPVVGAWKNMALRVVSTGGNAQNHIFYFDLAAGTGNQVTAASTGARAWDATTRLVFSNNAWNPNAEGTNGRYRCAKLWERLLTEVDTQSEAASCDVVTSATSLWGQWKLCTDLLDTSGNGRNLSNNGTVSFTDDGCGATPRLRMLLGVGQ